MHCAARRGHVRAEALVVLHVACGQVFGRGVVELGKQILGRLAHGVNQHIQTAPVGHADDDFLHALGASRLNQLMHGGDKAFAPFEREAFLANIFGMEKTLQAFSSRQALQDCFFLFSAKIWLAADAFELLLPPALLRLVAGVHVLGANRAAIGFAQCIEQLAQAHGVFAEEGVARVEHDFLIGAGKAVERRVQLGNVVALGALERVQIGPAGAHIAVSGDQLLNSGALAAQFGVGAGDDNLGLALLGALGKCVNDGQVRHIFGIAAIDGGDVLERVKIVAPAIGDAGRIGQIVFVHLFDIGRIAAEKVGIALVG